MAPLLPLQRRQEALSRHTQEWQLQALLLAADPPGLCRLMRLAALAALSSPHQLHAALPQVQRCVSNARSLRCQQTSPWRHQPSSCQQQLVPWLAVVTWGAGSAPGTRASLQQQQQLQQQALQVQPWARQRSWI